MLRINVTSYDTMHEYMYTYCSKNFCAFSLYVLAYYKT